MGEVYPLIELDPDVTAAELHARAAEIRARPGVLACIVGQRSLYVISGSRDFEISSGPARAPVVHRIEVNFNGPEMREEFRARMDGLRLTARYLGFRAGFAYLDGWPRAFAIPRQPTSRPVKRGTFAVAGTVAGFYPIDTPGGWNLLGTTDALLWDARRDPPNLIEAGDEIMIVPVDREMHPPENIEELPPEPIDGVEIIGRFASIVGLPDYSRIATGRSPGGAFDEASAIAANRAVGNRDDAPVIECAMLGPKVRLRERRTLAWVGADCDLPSGAFEAEGEINGGRIHNGLRGWLAIYQNPRPAKRGEGGRRPGEGRLTIGINPGPHEPTITNVECEVTPQLNRVGIRLRPLHPLPIQAPADLPSCGMQFGTIQLHPDGSLMAMGPDHPITGGYLQPMTVRWDERWKLAQLSPGERVRFYSAAAPYM